VLGEVLVREMMEELVEAAARELQQRVLAAAPADADDDIMPVFPAREKLADQARRILQIAVDLDRRRAAGVPVRGQHRPLKPEIARQADDLHAWIGRGERA